MTLIQVPGEWGATPGGPDQPEEDPQQRRRGCSLSPRGHVWLRMPPGNHSTAESKRSK